MTAAATSTAQVTTWAPSSNQTRLLGHRPPTINMLPGTASTTTRIDPR